MTAAIRIRRLDLRIRRLGPGWCMPSDHHALAERVRAMVLAELEPVLAAMLAGPEAAAAASAGPLHIELRVAPSALEGGAGAAAGLRAQASAALRLALAQVPAPAAPAALRTAGPDRPVPRRARDREQPATALSPPSLLRVLLRWRAEGVLQARLARWDTEMLARCHDAVLVALQRCPLPPGGHPAEPPARPGTAGPVATNAATHDVSAVSPPAAGLDPPGRPLAVLLDLVALASLHAGWRPPPSALRRFGTLHQVAAVMDPPRVLQDGSRAVQRPSPECLHAAAAAHPAPAADSPGAASPPPARAMPDRAELATALPFLLLGPLHRTGWLEAVALALALGGEAHAPAVGFALAVKALPMPARGWRHDSALLQAAALAAGLAEPPPGAALAAAERALAPLLGAADAVVADALLRGHAPGMPVGLVRRADGLLVLLEPEGLFPIGLAEDWTALASCVPPDAPVLVGGAVPPALLHAVAAGHRFAAPGAAVRGESWRGLSGPGGWRGITNADASLGPAAADWAERAPQAVAVAEALGPERPLAPGLAGGTLDRGVMLAAGLALGSMAWALAERDPAPWAQPDPLLAFDRFTSLSARLRASPAEIEVLLPLGPRSRDLRAAGLLGDVPGVPWLAGRHLRFGVA